MTKEENWQWKFSQLLDESEDEHRETGNSTLDANSDVKIDCISKIRDDILDEYPRWIHSNSRINEWTLYF